MAKKQIANTSSDLDTYSYKGWLNSDSFLKRAFAIVGYQTVAGLIIYGVILVIVLVFVLFAALFGLILG